MPTKKETLSFIKENNLKKDLGLSAPSSMSVQDLNIALDKFFDKAPSGFSSIGNKWKRLKLKEPLTPAELEKSQKSVKRKQLAEGTFGGSSKAQRKDPTMKTGGLDKFFARDLKKGRVYEVSYYGKKNAKVLDFTKGKEGLIDKAEVELPDGKKVTLPIKKFLKLAKATDIDDEIADLLEADEMSKTKKRIQGRGLEPMELATPSQKVVPKKIGKIDKSKIKSTVAFMQNEAAMAEQKRKNRPTYKKEVDKIRKEIIMPAIKNKNKSDLRDGFKLIQQLQKKYGKEPITDAKIDATISKIRMGGKPMV